MLNVARSDCSRIEARELFDCPYVLVRKAPRGLFRRTELGAGDAESAHYPRNG